jgi:hypothetical protein
MEVILDELQTRGVDIDMRTLSHHINYLLEGQGRVYTTRGPWHFLRAGHQIFAFSIDYNLEIYLVLSINRSDVAFASHIATLLKSETKLETRVVYINLVFEIFYL